MKKLSIILSTLFITIIILFSSKNLINDNEIKLSNINVINLNVTDNIVNIINSEDTENSEFLNDIFEEHKVFDLEIYLYEKNYDKDAEIPYFNRVYVYDIEVDNIIDVPMQTNEISLSTWEASRNVRVKYVKINNKLISIPYQDDGYFYTENIILKR